ncbi:MAG: alpha/beta fold hydrolase [Planktomarina sp.]
MLNFIRYDGPTDVAPLLIAHGLYGSARNWGVIAKRLSDERTVVSVDMRNHGDSLQSEDHSYPALAADLSEIIADLGGTVDLLGHSMGGKAAMVCALNHPGVHKLIVADIAPVAYEHSQQRMIDAMRTLDLNAIETRADADTALALVLDDPSIRAFLLQSLDVRGKRWKLNLDALEAEMAKIVGFPAITGQFTGPNLFLSGGTSDYVLPEHRPVIKDLFPKARFAKLPKAGHWLHAEDARGFEAATRVFLNA